MIDSDTRSVSSLFDNVAQVLDQRAPRSGRAMMGARWSFGYEPPQARSSLCEYSMPAGYVDALGRRSGLEIVEHSGAESLDAHIASGEVAIAVVDSFYLGYRPAFGRVHSGRTIQVRAGRHLEEVWITDRWLPAYEGPLARAALERARHSCVPLDEVREPIFAGRAIDGEWYSVAVHAVPITDARDWATSILRELLVDGIDGIAMLRQLRDELRECNGFIARPLGRELSLLLRSELSTRVFLCSFLHAAAGWRVDPSLRDTARQYYDALRSMQMARDLLVKNLTHPRLEYTTLASDELASTISAEEWLARSLETNLRGGPHGALS